MGFFDWFKGKKSAAEAPELEPVSSHLAFVLLREAQVPDAAAIVEAFAGFAGEDESLQEALDDEDEPAEESNREVAMLELEGIGTAFVALAPMAVPEGEAEAGFPFSMSSFTDDAKLEDHQAHLIVSLMGIEPTIKPTKAMMAFTSLLAAVVKATPSVGVYWGNAGATHTAEFFLDVAAETSIVPRILLWNGMSRSQEPDGRFSVLSRGMNQIALPDLYLIAGPATADGAIERLFDLLAYVADRGEAISAGDTIGATADERITVEYVPSPAEDGSIVWSIQM